MAALGAANEAMLRTTTEEELFQHVCGAAVAEGQFVLAAAMIAGPDNLLHLAAGSGKKLDDLRTFTPSVENSAADAGLAVTAFRTGQPVVANDYLRDPRCRALWPLAERIDLRSCAVVPIRQHGRSIGTLTFGLDKPNALDTEAVGLLDRIAANVSFALDNFEREKQRRNSDKANKRLARMLAALSATNEAIMRAETRKELLDRVVEAAMLDGIFSATLITLVEPDRSALRVVVCSGEVMSGTTKGMLRPIDTSQPLSLSLAELAFKTGKAQITEDYSNDPRLLHSEKRNGPKLAGGVFPLFTDGAPIGTMGFLATESGVFTPDLVELVQRLADNVSFALANFDRADEKSRIGLHQQRLARMFAALSATNEAIMRAETRQALLDRVCDAAVLEGMFSSVLITLAEPDRQSLRVVGSIGGELVKPKTGSLLPIDTSQPRGRPLPNSLSRPARSASPTIISTIRACCPPAKRRPPGSAPPFSRF